MNYHSIRLTLGKIFSKRKEVPGFPSEIEDLEHSSKTIVLIGPSYDELTGRMAIWLEELIPFASIPTRALIRDDASFSEMVDVLKRDQKNDFLIVFYGHGDLDSFLTAPGLGFSANEHNNRHSKLFSKEYCPDSCVVHIVGYCCLSARRLGSELRQVRKENRFIGFLDNIPFILGNSVRESAFKRPMKSLLMKALLTGFLEDDAVTRLKQEYAKEYSRWFYNYEQLDDQAMMICMCLEEHWQHLDTKM
jgi:hypothetical protein